MSGQLAVDNNLSIASLGIHSTNCKFLQENPGELSAWQISSSILRDCPPSSCTVLSPHQVCYLKGIHGAVVDVDDTQILGSGEHVHDGPKARFARAIMSLVGQKTGSSVDFNHDSWENYRNCSGAAEIAVCESMASLAQRQFLISITGEEVFQEACRQLHLLWDELLCRVSVAPGLTDLLDNLRRIGAPAAVCSASSEAFVPKVLEHFGLDGFYTAMICGAQKKMAPGVFSGNPVVQAADNIGVSPKSLCMIGDSIADYGSAAMAGVPIVILRMGAEQKKDAITDLFKSIRLFKEGIVDVNAEEGKTLIKNLPTLIIVPELSCVRFIKSVSFEPPSYLIVEP